MFRDAVAPDRVTASNDCLSLGVSYARPISISTRRASFHHCPALLFLHCVGRISDRRPGGNRFPAGRDRDRFTLSSGRLLDTCFGGRADRLLIWVNPGPPATTRSNSTSHPGYAHDQAEFAYGPR